LETELKAAVDKVLQWDLHITWCEETVSDSFCLTQILTSTVTENFQHVCCQLLCLILSQPLRKCYFSDKTEEAQNEIH
jgi:hypothetical protein